MITKAYEATQLAVALQQHESRELKVLCTTIKGWKVDSLVRME